MRTLHEHETNPATEAIRIEVLDEPGPGGANHVYQILVPSGATTPSNRLEFQNGPIGEVGVNGITNEALLAVVIDRMRGFQKGQFACNENHTILNHLKEAMFLLHERTKQREARGVEGTMQP